MLRREFSRMAKLTDGTHVPYLDPEAMIQRILTMEYDADEHEREMKLLLERISTRDIVVYAAIELLEDPTRLDLLEALQSAVQIVTECDD